MHIIISGGSKELLEGPIISNKNRAPIFLFIFASFSSPNIAHCGPSSHNFIGSATPPRISEPSQSWAVWLVVRAWFKQLPGKSADGEDSRSGLVTQRRPIGLIIVYCLFGTDTLAGLLHPRFPSRQLSHPRGRRRQHVCLLPSYRHRGPLGLLNYNMLCIMWKNRTS